jgi:hypothetical protein
MIARHRGEHDSHWGRWRPSAGRQPAAASPRQIEATAGDTLSPAGPAPRRGSARSRLRRAVRWLVALAAAAGVYLATSWGLSELAAGPGQPRLPVTPRAWLDAYEAAAVDNPARVCSQLFAPQLARAYAKAVHGSCRSYFRRITSFSVIVRRVLQDGGTAVLELRQTVRPRDWAVVLNRRRAGWQAVDLLAGDLAR